MAHTGTDNGSPNPTAPLPHFLHFPVCHPQYFFQSTTAPTPDSYSGGPGSKVATMDAGLYGGVDKEVNSPI